MICNGRKSRCQATECEIKKVTVTCIKWGKGNCLLHFPVVIFFFVINSSHISVEHFLKSHAEVDEFK